MKPPRLQGHTLNDELSEQGQDQARRTAELLSSAAIQAVYSSPLLRAQETASFIASPHDLKIQTIDQLIEVDVGHWEGMQWDEIETSDPENYRKFIENSTVHGYPGGETVRQVLRRAQPTIEQLMAKHAGQEIVAVAHNVVIRSFLAALLGLPESAWRNVPQSNCGVNLLKARNGEIKVKTINAAGHLA